VSDDLTQAQKAFVESMEKKVESIFGNLLDGKFSMMSFPSGFNWGVQFGPNDYYNEKALKEIDCVATYGTNGILTLGLDNFHQMYDDILNSVAFDISADDKAKTEKEQQNAESQISSVITEWETSMGEEITDTMIANAKAIPPNKLGYIENQVDALWNGDIRNAPISMASFVNAYESYASAATISSTIYKRVNLAEKQRSMAIMNAETPSAENGGFKTGSKSFFVAFDGIPKQNDINSGLQGPSSVSISLSINNFSSTESDLHIDGSTSFRVPLAGLISLSIGLSAEYDLHKYCSSSSSLDMTMTYPGLTIIGSRPMNLSANVFAKPTGWYFNQILEECVANAGRDVTGFQLKSSEFTVDKYFGYGKKFARIKTLVISQLPTIVLTFKSADTNMITQDFKEKLSVKVKLFGLFSIGEANESYEVHKVDYSSQTGVVTITLAPPVPQGTTPAQDATAYVFGGVPSYPPNN